MAGSVAANAADLPLVSSLPLVGNGQPQAAPAVPAHMAVPQMGSSKAATPKHEANRQKAVVSKGARPGYSGGRHGDVGDDPSVVIGNASGNRTIVGTGNTSVNAPVNVCGNPEAASSSMPGDEPALPRPARTPRRGCQLPPVTSARDLPARVAPARLLGAGRTAPCEPEPR